MNRRQLIFLVVLVAILTGGLFLLKKYYSGRQPGDTWTTQLPPLSSQDRAALPRDFPRSWILGANINSLVYSSPSSDLKQVEFLSSSTPEELTSQYKNIFTNTFWKLQDAPKNHIQAIKGDGKVFVYLTPRSGGTDVVVQYFYPKQ